MLIDRRTDFGVSEGATERQEAVRLDPGDGPEREIGGSGDFEDGLQHDHQRNVRHVVPVSHGHGATDTAREQTEDLQGTFRR
ncbi:hypothetical protein ACF1HU_00710 [Streptomyces olivaceus]|uniref:hypothetical protein n=1 Tax=Streptomyces olivaceus TaxID=47716 RepID=UPI0012FF2A93|nr:hypothetical protein [Streptomyces olivaceus]MBZ6104123.1 hypothetical protein [Streptomyces olivaceus]